MAVTIIEMPITKVVQETYDTRTFRLQPPASLNSTWKPGQFITVNFPEDPKTRRAYSLSSSPYDGDFLEITIKRMGNFGTRIYDTGKVDTTLQVIPPRGKFLLPEDPARPLLLI